MSDTTASQPLRCSATPRLYLVPPRPLGSGLAPSRFSPQVERLSSKNVAAVILGGGAGTRLYPLTKQRAKPAVPIGGAYRLIDVPMSNCINSGIIKIYVLTQANTYVIFVPIFLVRPWNLAPDACVARPCSSTPPP